MNFLNKYDSATLGTKVGKHIKGNIWAQVVDANQEMLSFGRFLRERKNYN
jgi:hypothetical protein